jgi:hypothetical protein
MDGAKIPLTFRIYKGDELVRTETLTQSVIKVGKLSSSHLRIEDELVSRMHAVIEVGGPGDISIIDLGSTKGTEVNGQKVNKAKLQDGDIIVLGDTRIVLGVGEPQENTDEIPTRVAEAAAAAPHAGAAPVAPPPRLAVAAPTPAAQAVAAGAPSRPAAAPQFGLDAAEDMGGARAIEVAAMLSDSVVAVRHLTNPKGGKVSSLTYGLFGGGAVALLIALAAFWHGLGVAERNQRDFSEWLEPTDPQCEDRTFAAENDKCQKHSAADFRPIRMAVGWDLMALCGLFGGLFSLAWGFTRYLNERESPFFRIGRDKDVEFPTDNAPSDAFALVGPAGDDFVFSWAQGMKGEMVVAGKTTPLEQLPQTTSIPHGARIRVESGPNIFLVSSVPAPRADKGGFFANFDGDLLPYLGGTLVVVMGLLLLVRSVPPDARTLALDLLGGDQRLNRVQVKPAEEPKQVEDLSQNKKDDGQQSGGTGTRQKDEEGKMGKKDSTRQSGQYAMKNNNADPQLAKQQAIENAQRSGILGVLKSSPGGAFASLTGTGDFSSGLDDRDVYGGLIGNEVGEMAGGFGYGLSGTGPGGGGTGLGTIGTGRYGTIGHGSGTGSGYGVGSGKGGMHGRSSSVPRVNIGTAQATGDLDKNIIRRYIRQKLPQIQHCYERQLTVKPALAGTVTTQFTINGNGSVISARGTGMGDRDVESCIEEAIRSIQFPKPTGGGIVNVTYPFTFRTAGE